MLRAILTQLVLRDDELVDILYDMSAEEDHAINVPLLEQLCEMALERQKSCFIVVDGLDEWPPEQAEKIISWLRAQATSARPADSVCLRIFLSGQRTGLLCRLLSSNVDISLDVQEHQSDILNYVKKKAKEVKDRFRLDTATENIIVDSVSAQAKSLYGPCHHIDQSID